MDMKQQRRSCGIWGRGAVVAVRWGYGYVITMLNMEVVGISGGGQVEVFVGGRKVGRKGQNHDDHWLDIVIVLVMKIAYIG